MLIMVIVSLIVFGCGRIRVSKRETQVNESKKNDVPQTIPETVTVIRN
jgi:hypothetical protein